MDAPPGPGGFEEAGELKRLRRRAYGRDADIARDAAAQARLSELEHARRIRLVPHDAAASGASPASEGSPRPERIEGSGSSPTSVQQPVDRASAGQTLVERPRTGQGAPEGPIVDSARAAGPAAAPWWRRRRWLAILAGAFVIVAMNAALGAWVLPPLAQGLLRSAIEASTVRIPPLPDARGRPEDNAPNPDMVLALESVGVEADRPKDPHGTLDRLGIRAENLRRYEDHYGVSVWSGESRYGMVCLFVAAPERGLRDGLGAEGCSPDGFTTVAEWHEPSGHIFRFVLRGDQVNVYLYGRDPDGAGGAAPIP
jgi:hypothetical protein